MTLKINQWFSMCLMTLLVFFTTTLKAAEPMPSASNSLFKMLIGLAIVLLILALISWAMKKYMGHTGTQQSVIRVVGGVSVGTRERVMVLEVADRWLVVGVAPGHVTSIANLEVGDSNLLSQSDMKNSNPSNTTQHNSFAKWLKKSSANLTEKQDAAV
jgi:flagellar protein FliO/FliZ